jgi:iron complex transport system substrate-binding protein
VRIAVVGVLALSVLVACAGGAGDGEGASDATAAPVEAATTIVASTTIVESTAVESTDTTVATAEMELPERIVALSEEFLLADLLALGVQPIASTSNADDGFVGLDPALTDDIEVIPTGEFNLELLALLRPDLIVAYPDYLDLVDRSALAAIAPVVEIGDGDGDWRERLRSTAEAFGIADIADDVVASTEATLAEVRTDLDGRVVSVASITPGPLVRAFTDERSTLTEVMVELGLVLRPSADEVAGTDDNGRAELSLEQLGLLDGDAIVLLQATFVEGVDDAVAQVAASPLWSSLPAVQAGRVVTIDQLAYPGAAGVGRFAMELSASLVE